MSFSCVELEMRCVLHWFGQWNAAEKDSFLEDLVEKAVPNKIASLFSAMESMTIQTRAPDLFSCQLRLFDQWFEGWTDKDRNAFVQKLEENDYAFVSRFNAAVAGTCNMP
jgi:hypothetical protein